MESIGGLEEVILLILLNNEKIHGVEIGEQYEAALKKTISLPAIHVVLKRMEKKGWVKSAFGEPSSERGGKRKRMYWATSTGYHIIREAQEKKSALWSGAAKPQFEIISGVRF